MVERQHSIRRSRAQRDRSGSQAAPVLVPNRRSINSPTPVTARPHRASSRAVRQQRHVQHVLARSEAGDNDLTRPARGSGTGPAPEALSILRGVIHRRLASTDKLSQVQTIEKLGVMPVWHVRRARVQIADRVELLLTGFAQVRSRDEGTTMELTPAAGTETGATGDNSVDGAGLFGDARFRATLSRFALYSLGTSGWAMFIRPSARAIIVGVRRFASDAHAKDRKPSSRSAAAAGSAVTNVLLRRQAICARSIDSRQNNDARNRNRRAGAPSPRADTASGAGTCAMNTDNRRSQRQTTACAARHADHDKMSAGNSASVADNILMALWWMVSRKS